MFGVARYVVLGARKSYPAPLATDGEIPKWERQNKKNVVTSSIWVEHHESLLKISAESKINEVVNKRKIENIARTATSAAAEVSYGQNKHEISKRPRVDVNAENDDEDNDGVWPSDSFGAKSFNEETGSYYDEDSDEISERIRPFDATSTSATGEKHTYSKVLAVHYAGESLTSVSNVGPCASLPRAKQFLSDADVQKLRQKAANVIMTESQLNSSVKAFLEALMLSNIVSLQEISKSKRANGTAGIYALLCQRLQEGPHQLMQKEIIPTEAINRNVADVRELCAQLEHVLQRSEDDVDHQLTLLP
ncbi:hypothetical protein BC936DRAFT_142256 [Jimgerdemannia flammicorona]|uniref:Uncharacterized protein n=1 Tax=Jimgerdemannia flammicorona TaxID=994334 RepID=A0A433A0L2_9FUNG|nr:hypothetical protein BC936DRAFT_142256 [Jimgerdemannia flammicorona]